MSTNLGSLLVTIQSVISWTRTELRFSQMNLAKKKVMNSDSGTGRTTKSNRPYYYYLNKGKYKEARFRGELVLMEADRHYSLSCCGLWLYADHQSLIAIIWRDKWRPVLDSTILSLSRDVHMNIFWPTLKNNLHFF